MRNYSDVVLAVLEKANWYPGRNVFNELKLSGEKKCFRAAKEVYSEFGLLKLEYVGRDGPQTIYFDVDDSCTSKNMRAEMFGCDSYLDPSLANEPDFEPSENFKWTKLAESYRGEECARIGVLEDQIGYGVFIVGNGNIYLAHGQEPILSHMNIFDFMNATILGIKDTQ